jgi:hypothetical protein
MPEQTMPLRDAAQSLARAKNPKAKGIQSSKLLSLLKSGELKAGFYILGGSIWIEIPLAYWETIGVDKFRIGRSRDDPKSGTYKLSLSRFAPEVAKVICKQLDANEKSSARHESSKTELLTAVVDSATKSYEVTVKTKDFQEYLNSHGPEEPITAAKGGRHRKEGWREICSYMAAYMTAHQRDLPEVRMKIKETSEEIFRLAKADEVKDPPSAGTIKEEISKAMSLLQKDDFQLKK